MKPRHMLLYRGNSVTATAIKAPVLVLLLVFPISCPLLAALFSFQTGRDLDQINGLCTWMVLLICSMLAMSRYC